MAMLRHGLMLLAAAGLTGGACRASDPLNPSETELFARIDRATATNPPTAAGIASAFGLDAACANKTCFFDQGKIAGLSYAQGNLRPGKDGVIFVLEKFSGECIHASAIAARYRVSEAEQTCSDAVCWYRNAHRDWGIIGFEVATPQSQCVSSVVINTSPEWRAAK
jgi:hypothetical protein